MKKLIALMLALVAVLSLCAGCGGGGSNIDEDGLTEDGKVLLTIGLPTNALILDFENNALTKWVEDKTGYALDFMPYSGGTDVATQISTTVAAQERLPDILLGISLGDEVVNRYGNDGYFIDLSSYYADRDGASKTFWTRLEETFSESEQENIVRLMTEPESGAIYSVPTLETSLVDIMDYQMWINTEWLDKLGLEMPTDPDSLYKTLVAFKTKDPNGNGQADELPLYGSQEGSLGADVVNWLVNMYLYFNDTKHFNIDENGKLYAPFTTDEYREALKFVNKLIDEKLMLDSVFNTKSSEMKMITTPASGTALCGIFAGHLTLHASIDNEVLYQYQPLPLWGNAVYNDNTNRRWTYITADCKHPDEAFDLLMTLWSEEASYRLRYGEYGVNWADADEGAVSDLGLPATIKILRDPLQEQNTCRWGTMGATLVVYSEGETAQMTVEQSEWAAYKSQLHAQSRKNFDEAAAKYNPPQDQICPSLVYTEQEKDATEAQRTACADYYKKTRTDFCTGKLDPYSDADWNEYLKTLNDLGLKDWLALAQKAYDRQ